LPARAARLTPAATRYKPTRCRYTWASEANLPSDVANVVRLCRVPVHVGQIKCGPAAKGEAAVPGVNFPFQSRNRGGSLVGRLEQALLHAALPTQLRGGQLQVADGQARHPRLAKAVAGRLHEEVKPVRVSSKCCDPDLAAVALINNIHFQPPGLDAVVFQFLDE